MLETFSDAAAYLVDPSYWIALFAGLFLSIMVSIVPGVSSILVMAISLPFILININDPVIGIIMLATIVGTNNTLDSVPAILLGLPSSATQVTFLEGHQLARQGKAGYTLGAVFGVSALGGVFGALILAAIIPIIRPFVLSFSFGEIAVIALFGVTMVSILSRGAMIKGLIAGAAGLFLGTVQVEPFNGAERYIFGQWDLVEGLPVIAIILGVFALPEVIDLTMRGRPVAMAANATRMGSKEVWAGCVYGMKSWRMTLRQSGFGVLMGAIPGVGSGVIDWLSYAFGMIWSKDTSMAGKGWLDGVLFAESAQNAKESGQAVPTLALGIPGGTGWIIIIVAMMAYGVSPGPEMLGRNADLTIVMVFTIGLGNLLITIIGLMIASRLVYLTTIPYPLIASVIIPIVIISAYLDFIGVIAIHIVLIFTVVGLLMKRHGWPRPPMIIAFILGPIIEQNFWSAVSVHGLADMLLRPLTIVLFFLVIGVTYLLNIAMSRAESTQEQLPTISGGSGKPSIMQRPWTLRFHWRWEHLIPMFLMAGGILAVIEALDFGDRGTPFPVGIGIAIAALSAVQLFRQATTPPGESARIMDLGMASGGESGATRRGLKVLLGLAIFMGLGMTVGLKYGAIAFAFLGPLLLMEVQWKWRLMNSAIAGALLCLFIFLLADYIMAIVWPEPILQSWLGD